MARKKLQLFHPGVAAYVGRFGDYARVTLIDPPVETARQSVYLTQREARELGEQLLAVADNMRLVPFGGAAIMTVEVARDTSIPQHERK